MSALATNDAGEVMAFDGKEWKPAQIAENERGERMAFDGKEWQRLGPPPSLGNRVMDTAKATGGAIADGFETSGNYRDTQFSKAMGSVAGLPRMAADAMGWAGKKVGDTIGVNPVAALPLVGPAIAAGQQLPTGEEASRFMLDRAQARPGFKETSINPVVDAGVQALFAGPVLGAGGKMGPLVNAGAAMGSEGAGELTEGTPFEPYARAAGGVVGALSPYAIQKGSKAVMSLVEPFTKGGRDKIVGAALTRGATDPKAAIANMDNYSPPVPKFQLAAGKASRDPGMMAIQEVAEARPGSVLRGFYDKNNALLTDNLDNLGAGLPPASTAGETIQKTLRERFDDFVKARSAKSDPLYTAARNSQTAVDPTDAWAVASRASGETVGEPQKLMKTVEKFFTDPTGPLPTTPKGLMAIRDAIGDMQDDLSMGKFSKSLLSEVKKRVDDALAVVPEEKLARETFALHSKPLESFDAKLGNKAVADVIAKDKFGKDFLMPAEKAPSQFMRQGNLSAPVMQKFLTASGGDIKSVEAMRSYVLDDFRKAAISKVAEDATGNARMTANGAAKWLDANRGAAVNVLTPDQVKGLETITKALKEQSASIPGRTGSPTFDRLATESILGAFLSPSMAEAPLLHPIKKALGIVYGGANEAAMNTLFDALQDPKVASALMKKANAGNVKMAEPVLQSLVKGAGVSQVVGRGE